MLDNGVSVGRYCGSVQPPVITSSSNTLEIHFKSDDSINGRGFVAYYTFTGKTASGAQSDLTLCRSKHILRYKDENIYI